MTKSNKAVVIRQKDTGEVLTVLGRFGGILKKKAAPIKTTEVAMFCNQHVIRCILQCS